MQTIDAGLVTIVAGAVSSLATYLVAVNRNKLKAKTTENTQLLERQKQLAEEQKQFLEDQQLFRQEVMKERSDTKEELRQIHEMYIASEMRVIGLQQSIQDWQQRYFDFGQEWEVKYRALEDELAEWKRKHDNLQHELDKVKAERI